MASTINALTTGVGGVQTTGDTSGNISLQSNGSNVLNTTSSGVTVPGTLGVTGTSSFTGAMSANGGLAVTGTLTVNGASPGRSGAGTINLSSGTTNVTLTSSSNQAYVVSSTGDGYSITLPNATTMTAGSGYFTFYNTSPYGIAIKDNTGVVREYITVTNQLLTLTVTDTSTQAGVWRIQNPTNAGSFTQVPYSNTFSWTGTGVFLSMIKINATQFVCISTSSTTANGNTWYANLATFNSSTLAWTFGSSTAIQTNNGSYFSAGAGGDSNQSDRGVIRLSQSTVLGGTGPGHYAVGFAVVSGTLYFSAGTQYYSSPVNKGISGSNGVIQYTGANNVFIASSSAQGGGASSCTCQITGWTVGVSGTTVSLTAASGTLSITGSSSAYFARVTSIGSTTTGVVQVDSSPYYFSYNTSTNTITSASGASLVSGIYFIDGLGARKMIMNAANTKLLIAGDANVAIYDVANPGTSSVSFAASSNITNKVAASASYVSSAYSVIGTDIYVTSSSSYQMFGTTFIYDFDPSTSTFNINYATFTPGYNATSWWLSASSILVFYNSTYRLVTPATLYKG
jgi:hypothetical protein